MFTKNGLFLGCMAMGMSVAVVANAQMVEVIRAEDEALLSGITVREEGQEQPVVVQEKVDTRGVVEYQEENVSEAWESVAEVEDERQKAEPYKVEWFNPAELPTNIKKIEDKGNDAIKNEYRQAINACMDDVKERLYMERDLFEGGEKSGIAYLSHTMAEVNLCYEKLGREIIERYYGNDRTLKRSFSKKTEEFYVSGVGVDFEAEFCGENCSMSNILDAQLKKFGDFRLYLYKLVDNIPEGK